MVGLFRDKIKSRGARGIIGLQRLFKIFDDDNSKSLNDYEFKKAINDFRINIPEDHLSMIFDYFDVNGDGTINYDEFLRAVRGEMNSFRRGLAIQAFNKLDKDGSGAVDIDDIRDIYNGKKHPDVINGKKTEEQILMDFLETFETHHSVRSGGANDSSVTQEEWIEYYNNISISIDDDPYFEQMMNSSWNIKGNAAQYKTHAKAWTDNDKPTDFSSRPQTSATTADFRQQRSGMESTNNPLCTTQQYYQKTQAPVRHSISNTDYLNTPHGIKKAK